MRIKAEVNTVTSPGRGAARESERDSLEVRLPSARRHRVGENFVREIESLQQRRTCLYAYPPGWPRYCWISGQDTVTLWRERERRENS